MANQVDGTILLSPSISGTIKNSHSVSGSIALTLSISGTINSGQDVTGNTDVYWGYPAVNVSHFTIPALKLIAEGGATASVTLPAIILSATGKANVVGKLEKAIPSIHLSATGFNNPFGNLAQSIPLIRLSASGSDSPVGSLERPIPSVILTASGIAGIIGNLTQPIPSVELAAAAWWLGGADLSKAIPAIKLTAHARAAEIVALAINMKNFGLSTYTNYDYNSLCMFNGKLVGATRTGIYELEGSDDEGTAIPWKIRTGKLDIKTSRLRHVWLSGTISGDIKLIVETAEGDRYEYDAEPVSESEDEIRVKVGKGIASKYVIIELQNESDQTITLDKMQVYGMPKER